MDRVAVVAMLAVLVGSIQDASAQQLQSEAPAESAAITVAARIGGKDYQGSGTGSCRHEPEASIRGVSAALWVVEYAGQKGALKQLNPLTRYP